MKPYGLMADLHLNNWNAFSTVEKSGINSRLLGLLGEIDRCADQVKKTGGDKLYIAGDVFHVRGNIAPSVLNPALETLRGITASGITIYILAGNHDLEGKHSERISSAITALEGAGCVTINERDGSRERNILSFPWYDNQEDLKQALERLPVGERANLDVLLHAPIDGTLPGIPAHGISPDYLASLGYRRILAGHYHHHRDFGNGVYSIGALAHHTWSDVRTKAGFLIVSDDEVKWFKSHLPEFVDITAEIEVDDVPLLVEGNFVRARTDSAKVADVESLRAELLGHGAKGVIIQTVKKPTERDSTVSASVSAGASLEVSVSEFIKGKSFPDAKQVTTACMTILAEAGC